MKKLTVILLTFVFILSFSFALAQNALPTVTFPQKEGRINCGSEYSFDIKLNQPASSDLEITIQCAALSDNMSVTVPAGTTIVECTVVIPEDVGGKKLNFSVLPGEGYTCGKLSHALQVYPMPRIQFYSNYMVNIFKAGHEITVRAECQNPAAVLPGSNTFSLRNHRGETLDTITWTNPRERAVFRFESTKALAGKQVLSVWQGDKCVSPETGLLYINDISMPRFKTLSPSKPAMSLTLDCGSPSALTPARTDEVLAVLDKYNVKATFFFTGVFLEQQTESARKIVAAGHEIGNHTYSHPMMTELDYRMMHQEITRCSRLCEELLGITPRYFRPPYGETNEKVTAIARGEGMEEVLWTINGHDTRPYFTHSMVVERITNPNVTCSGMIVLIHLEGLGSPQTLEQVIPFYQEKLGYRIVPVSELMKLSGLDYQPMPDGQTALVYQPGTW